ncbi:MAG: hypothetical protein PHH09_08435 [Methanoregulaceae archaeon]|nr:hypothetical protein [Methanoregulaceae archaeon]
MTVMPLSLPKASNKFTYIMLSEALSSGSIVINEVSEGGSVPELIARNTGKVPVLIMDGEELAGAKQNRVANTSILVPPLSKIVIPVSCTESGRWNYSSADFADSDVVMSRNIRAKKNVSVSENLQACHSFRSDQGEVWSEIDREIHESGASSHTSAMKDAHEQLRKSLGDYTGAFPYVEGQHGMIVYIGGKPAGIELLSDAGCFQQVHEKLIRSYAMEARRSRNTGKEPSEEDLRIFPDKITAASVNPYRSPGMGEDHRISGEEITGSALVCEDSVIHLTVFAIEETAHERQADGQNPISMESMARRRNRMRDSRFVF